jgi:hypothetical protein
MQIKNISNVFKSTKNIEQSENRSNHTNPFGVSFKGNMINADVFQSSESEGSTNRVNKFVDSIRVGSMSAFSSISNRFNSVVSFGQRIKSDVSNLWTQANNIEITLGIPSFTGWTDSIREKLNNPYSVNNLMKRDTSDLRDEFAALASV